ncbi:SRPBCC domain-containing protein [uncultured Croceitalea sp.]|uniref:SRPBCC family protein n=1 Tax=uncultured Croceitalea sp. TaxID=1798908 RepID=UPI0033066D44
MSKLNFNQFTKKIYIKAPIEKLFWCWSTAEGIESWFLRKAVYTSPNKSIRNASEHVQVNDSYAWNWHNWEEQERGSILQTNNLDFIEFSFAENCKVSVTLEQKENAVLVSLKQYEIPTDENSKLNIHHGCSNGWTFWLANLKAYLEHGILLNEREFDLTKIPLAGFEFVNM